MRICQMIKSEFYIEVEIKGDGFEEKYLLIFIYASSNEHIKRRQWEILKDKRKSWVKKVDIGRGF